MPKTAVADPIDLVPGSTTIAGALQHLSDTLETLGARGLKLTKPYAAQIAVKTPGGYPATMTIERTDSKEFFSALAEMTGWLAENHYVPL